MSRLLRLVFRSLCLVFALHATTGAALADPTPSLDLQPQCSVADGAKLAAGLRFEELPPSGESDVARRFAVYVPESLDASKPARLVVDLHGSGSGPEQELTISGLSAAAEAHGFLVVLPVAEVPFPYGGFTWNVPPNPQHADDAAFVADVLDRVEETHCVDPARIYVTGFSGGGRLATHFACAFSDRVAAVAAVGGLRAPAGCADDTTAPPLLAFHGTADPINPYEGGGPAYWGHGVEEALDAWVAAAGCAQTPARREFAQGAEQRTWNDCSGRAEIEFYRLDGAGHIWPGSKLPLPAARFGPTTEGVDATSLILDFFDRHRLPADGADVTE